MQIRQQEKRKGDWIQTYTQRQFWPLDPRPEDVALEDIAHALALTCRFGGHCNTFYSVAQHSVFVSELVRVSESLVGLLHDAPEAYLGDIVRPLKISLPDFNAIEEGVKKAVFQHFGIGDYDGGELKRADNVALFTEFRDLMGKPPEIWKDAAQYFPLLPEQKIVALGPEEGERLFLERYEQLYYIIQSKG